MSHDQTRSRPSLTSQIDVTAAAPAAYPQGARPIELELVRLLRDLVAAADRQNELLEELVNQLGAAQKQRANELVQWKQANPRLARNCRAAAEALGKIHTEFLESMTNEITENWESLMDGEFMLTEFVDRYGPRLAHLNGLLQVLVQLSASPSATNTSNSP